jgi:hypothetical protein
MDFTLFEETGETSEAGSTHRPTVSDQTHVEPDQAAEPFEGEEKLTASPEFNLFIEDVSVATPPPQAIPMGPIPSPPAAIPMGPAPAVPPPPVAPSGELSLVQQELPEATLSPVDLGPLMLEDIGLNLDHSLGLPPPSVIEVPSGKSDVLPPPPLAEPPAIPPVPPLPAEAAPPPPALPAALLQRVCSSCGKVYGMEYTDSFCSCGTELTPVGPSSIPSPPPIPGTLPGIPLPANPVAVSGPAGIEAVAMVNPLPPPPPPAVSPPAPQLRGSAERPGDGTRCLVLYGPDKKPLRYFPLVKDVTMIGRQDAVRGHFPDIDLSEWLDETTARKVSRKHAILLHSRQSDAFSLRPLAGNTGTQIESDMVEALQDYPLTSGTRLVLGGAVRFKFEVM